MTSVAYGASPPLPGWARTVWVLVTGWIAGAVVVGALYVAAVLAGAIGSNGSFAKPGVLNQWPYPDNGWWSLGANLSAILLVVLIATVATAWAMRGTFARFSETHLLLVLLFTGWLPFVAAGPPGGTFGFLLAVVLVRVWVARTDDHLPRRAALACSAVLVTVVASYGLLHPLWSTDAFASGTPSRSKLLIAVHNSARVPVTVERLDGGPLFVSAASPRGVRISAGADSLFALKWAPHACANVLTELRIRYRILGITFSEPLRARPSRVRRCR